MVRHLSRSLPALAAALAVLLVGAASFAVARDGSDRHRGSWGHGHGYGYGHGDKRCEGKRVSGLDARWLMVHVETNIFEIQGGEAAQARATTDEVRDFAARLVEDHTAALVMAREVASRVGVAVPDTPSPLQQWALRAVQEFSGPELDRWFADLQVEGHRQAITEAATEASKGCNRKVRRLAAASLPVLQHHLEEAEEILAGLDG